MNPRCLVLLEFDAGWCVPCQKVSPVLKDLAQKFKGKIRLVTVDVDTSSEMVDKYGVFSIPSVIFVRNGREVNRIVGAKSRSHYRAAIINSLKRE